MSVKNPHIKKQYTEKQEKEGYKHLLKLRIQFAHQDIKTWEQMLKEI